LDDGCHGRSSTIHPTPNIHGLLLRPYTCCRDVWRYIPILLILFILSEKRLNAWLINARFANRDYGIMALQWDKAPLSRAGEGHGPQGRG
jgi:hypothetical protein